MTHTQRQRSKRRFLKTVAATTALGFPSIVPATVLGAEAPSNQITIGAIGVGRISRVHDLPGVWKHPKARIMAVCDLDARRVEDAKVLINGQYATSRGAPYDGVTGYADYRELLANRDVDAVIISTPDHWHAAIGIAAARAGKHIYLQKPASLTIAEGRALSDEVHRSGVTFQIGSQQRSGVQFRRACELVRNGRIGTVKGVQVGLPGDPGGEPEPEMPVPAHFNYDMWLGSTPRVPYTEKRVHPQVGYDRPGWLRCEQFGAGMITGWGAHHIDTAHWGMDTEHTGPVEVWGSAEFPKSGLWNVHGPFRTEARYANGVHMVVSGEFPNGIRFEGTEGWIFVSRGNEAVTSSDPGAKLKDTQALAASDPRILGSTIGPDEVHLYKSSNHHGNWLECIRTRQQVIAPVEIAHRSCSACLLHHIAMKLPRRLQWDPLHERFVNDDEANALRSRPQRHPYVLPT